MSRPDSILQYDRLCLRSIVRGILRAVCAAAQDIGDRITLLIPGFESTVLFQIGQHFICRLQRFGHILQTIIRVNVGDHRPCDRVIFHNPTCPCILPHTALVQPACIVGEDDLFAPILCLEILHLFFCIFVGFYAIYIHPGKRSDLLADPSDRSLTVVTCITVKY